LLWEFQADAGIHAAASTFEHEGQQYVVALAAGSFFPNTKRGDSVWLFSLEGGLEPSGGSSNRADGDLETLTH
jgi:hypothetical protein